MFLDDLDPGGQSDSFCLGPSSAVIDNSRGICFRKTLPGRQHGEWHGCETVSGEILSESGSRRRAMDRRQRRRADGVTADGRPESLGGGSPSGPLPICAKVG